jgi:hypothetical protein
MTEPNTNEAEPSWRIPLDPSAPFEDVEAALLASEVAIPQAMVAAYQNRSAITHADFYAMGIARRANALSAGFRSMVQQRNSLCALPLVRMQLDTALRLYAGFFVTDHFAFCRAVIGGTQVKHLRADDGRKMLDRYLLERVAKANPWMKEVYALTSGHIHFSHHHIREALRSEKGRPISMVIGPTDHDREAQHFHEPMRCMHHLNLIIECALRDWLDRMSVPPEPGDGEVE